MTLVLTKKRQELLSRLHLSSYFDILNYFPRTYHDLTSMELSNEMDEQKVVITAKVIDVSPLVRFKQSRTRYTIYLDYQDIELKGIVFNREYFYRKLESGVEIVVGGKYHHLKREIMVSDLLFKKENETESERLKPLYSLFEGYSNKEFVAFIGRVYEEACDIGYLENVLPQFLHQKYRLIPRKDAYKEIHQPSSKEGLKQALRYLKFEELFVFSVAMKQSKMSQQDASNGFMKTIHKEQLASFYAGLPYELTEDQKQALREIFADLRSNHLMSRLLQGDVGSGKTLVAIASLVAVAGKGVQAAFMAPTDILARQHYQNVLGLLKDLPLRSALLVGAMSPSAKKEVYEQIARGEIDLVVGTHALIQESVNFHNLGLVVIDEQHRFGVKQRTLLKQKGEAVDLLLMSATPIPRTLALALYGDLDISTLYQFPSGKRDITTKLLVSKTFVPLLDEMDQLVQKGRKIYIICPLIENEESDLRSAIAVYEGLVKFYQGKYQIGLLHGKMKDEEKENSIQAFCNGDVSILVATTVVEVGVDVKSADMMIIYDAERFGLAQIHQLRGRIGRSGQKGTCYLFTNTSDENTLKRLRFLETCDDGFEISRFDLTNRGPGHLSGLKQSGETSFQLVDLGSDLNIFEVARSEAEHLFTAYQENQYPALRKLVFDYLRKQVEVIE